MQYYVTSTAGPPPPSGDGGASDTGDYQPSFNPLYNYRPIVSIALCGMQIARIKASSPLFLSRP